jgi:glycosyltransferase involved in cell wall biosynthesis
MPFVAWVCDSSDGDQRSEVSNICATYPWAQLRFHGGRNIAAARNFCVNVAEEELLVSIDDDVQITPSAIRALVDVYDRRTGPSVVAGTVVWGETPILPMVLRPIGYGRPVRDGEQAEFINSSLFLYPRAYGRQWPWNEKMQRGSDVLMGAIWRRAGVSMLWAPDARALHEEDRNVLTAGRHDDYVYALLAHALIPAKRLDRLALIETVTLAAGLKGYAKDRSTFAEYLRAWLRGHRAFIRDYRFLQELAARPIPDAPAGG